MELDDTAPSILVVDDTPENIQVVSSLLAPLGYSLAYAMDGAEALEAVAESLPDLILLDVMMPGMSGFEVCRRLKRDPRTAALPVIFLTARSDRESLLKGFDAGGVDYLTKPFHHAEMRARVASQVELVRQRQRLEVQNLRLREEVARRQAAEAEARSNLQRLRVFLDQIDDIACERAADGTPREANLAYRRLVGATSGDWRELIHPDDLPHLEAAFRAEARERFELDYRLRRHDGAWRWMHARLVAAPGGYYCVERDITERKELEQHALARLNHLLHHDAATGLPNRSGLLQLIEHELRRGAEGTLLVVGLEQIGGVREGTGNRLDRLLRQVADRLAAVAGEASGLARIGDAELALRLAPEIDGEGMAQQLIATLEAGIEIDGLRLSPRPLIGLHGWHAGDDPVTLLKQARAAMHRAQDKGTAGYRWFDPTIAEGAAERLTLESDLRRGLEEGQFELHYQPQVELAGRRLYGAEALVRWRHPRLGLRSPAEFIPLAEETGLILPLTEWVAVEAARQLVKWRAAGYGIESVAVNLSPYHFRHGRPDRLAAAVLAASGLAPERLELEITEGMLMADDPETLRMLQMIRDQGPRLAIDDFGAGYSSLGYLGRMPVNKLKIDRSFVTGLPDAGHAEVLIRAILDLAEGLGIAVIAEGVETLEQHDALCRLGCREGQGYLYGRPMPAEAFEKIMAAPAAR